MTPDLVTAMGYSVWLGDPTKTPVHPRDLRTHAGTLRRYLGAIDVTLLEHLAFCVELGREWCAAPAVLAHLALHDAHEVYLGDVPPRYKTHEWREHEARWSAWVHACLGVEEIGHDFAGAGPTADSMLVKMIDVAALLTEMTVHAHPGLRTASDHQARIVAMIDAIHPEWARQAARAWARAHEGPDPARTQWSILCDVVPALAEAREHRPPPERWPVLVPGGPAWGPQPRCWVRAPYGRPLDLEEEWWEEARWVAEERDLEFAAELGAEVLELGVDGGDEVEVDVLVPGASQWQRVRVVQDTTWIAL